MSAAGRRRTDGKTVGQSQPWLARHPAAGPKKKTCRDQQEVARQQLHDSVERNALASLWSSSFNCGHRCRKGQAHESIANIYGQPPETQHGGSML